MRSPAGDRMVWTRAGLPAAQDEISARVVSAQTRPLSPRFSAFPSPAATSGVCRAHMPSSFAPVGPHGALVSGQRSWRGRVLSRTGWAARAGALLAFAWQVTKLKRRRHFGNHLRSPTMKDFQSLSTCGACHRFPQQMKISQVHQGEAS